MTDEEIQKIERHLTFKIDELEKRISLHMAYQQEALRKAADDMDHRLASMNEFRDQLREQAARFVTVETLDERVERLLMQIDKRADVNLAKIEDIQRVITPGLGVRVSVLELAKSNLDGKFWALAAGLVILQVVIQLWPLLRPH